MNRTLEIPPEKLTPEQKTVFDQLVAGRGRILGPYKIWIHSPTVASGMEHIGTFLNKRCSLSSREVEIGILVIAQHWDADYVRTAHIREGKRVGLRKSRSTRSSPATSPSSPMRTSRPSTGSPPRSRAGRSSAMRSSPRSSRRSAARASPRCWCCSATTPRFPSG